MEMGHGVVLEFIEEAPNATAEFLSYGIVEIGKRYFQA